MVPVAGSAYTYSYATLGELVAWIIGWDLILEYAIGNVAVAISWANYFNTLPRRLRHSPAGLAHRSTTDGARPKMPQVVAAAPHIFGDPDRLQRARLSHRRRDHDRAGLGHPGVGELQLLDGRHQARRARLLRPRQRQVRQARALDARSRRTASPASPPAPRSSSSRTSASTPSRRWPRSARIPSATCRSASSARSILCTIIYVVVAAVFTGMIPYPALKATLSRRAGRAADARDEVRRDAGLDGRGRRVRVGRRAHGGAARLPARPAAHLLRDGARRPAAAGLREGASEVPDAARDDDPDRRARRRDGDCSPRSTRWST